MPAAPADKRGSKVDQVVPVHPVYQLRNGLGTVDHRTWLSIRGDPSTSHLCSFCGYSSPKVDKLLGGCRIGFNDGLARRELPWVLTLLDLILKKLIGYFNLLKSL